MHTVIPAPGTAPIAVPGPAPVPAATALADVRHQPTWERINDIAECVVYYGIMLFGLSMPVIGAVNAYLSR